jgi:hypothetical protein
MACCSTSRICCRWAGTAAFSGLALVHVGVDVTCGRLVKHTAGVLASKFGLVSHKPRHAEHLRSCCGVLVLALAQLCIARLDLLWQKMSHCAYCGCCCCRT